MTIYFKESSVSREEATRIILALPGVVPASGTSPGFEIPLKKPHKPGRIHIMFSSEGIEVHRDQITGEKHRVVQKSATAQAIFKTLKEKINAAKNITV